MNHETTTRNLTDEALEEVAGASHKGMLMDKRDSSGYGNGDLAPAGSDDPPHDLTSVLDR